MNHYIRLLLASFIILSSSCAGCMRGCSSWTAQSLGANWLVVQFGQNGTPFNCWQLHGVSIANEQQSDGIYWVDDTTGNLIHISGWYNRVQVSRFGSFDSAARQLGIDLNKCHNGRYAEQSEQLSVPANSPPQLGASP